MTSFRLHQAEGSVPAIVDSLIVKIGDRDDLGFDSDAVANGGLETQSPIL